MEKSKKAVYSILVLVLLIGSIFYFSNNKKENSESKPEAKSERKEEVKTELQKEKVIKKTEIKKSENNNSKTLKDVVYKNTPENEGINMELEVPEKWSYLDYSKLGQPEEVAISPEDYPVKLEDYYKKTDGMVFHFNYLDAKTEKKLLDLYLNEDFRDLISKFYDDEKIQELYDHQKEISESFGEEYPEIDYTTSNDYLSDINNLIYIDEKTGRKEINGMNNFFNYFCSRTTKPFGMTGCKPYNKLIEDDPIKESLIEEEFIKFKGYVDEYEQIMTCEYSKTNKDLNICNKTNKILDSIQEWFKS